MGDFITDWLEEPSLSIEDSKYFCKNNILYSKKHMKVFIARIEEDILFIYFSEIVFKDILKLIKFNNDYKIIPIYHTFDGSDTYHYDNLTKCILQLVNENIFKKTNHIFRELIYNYISYYDCLTEFGDAMEFIKKECEKKKHYWKSGNFYHFSHHGYVIREEIQDYAT